MPFIDTTGTLLDGRTFDEFHKDTLQQIAGEQFIMGSNIERLYWVIDQVFFSYFKNIDELKKLQDINYRHGLQLDDKGDEYGVERNGMDDDRYRFMLKSHNMVINSDGTTPYLVNIAASLLGCSINDLNISDERMQVDGKVNDGEYNTIDIKDINVENVANTDLIGMLSEQLSKATLASTKVRQLGFYETLKLSTSLYTTIAITEHVGI